MYEVIDDLHKAECLISDCIVSDDVRKNHYYLNRLRDIGSDLEILIDDLENNV